MSAGPVDPDGLRSRPFIVSAALIVATIAAGLAIRFAPLGLPYIVVKYGGSILWALMIYWICSSIRPHWHPARSALAAGAIALAVELFKLHHAPSIDAFRLTLGGKLLLGRVFSPWNLSAYALAIVLGATMDRAFRSRLSRVAAPLPIVRTPLSYRP